MGYCVGQRRHSNMVGPHPGQRLYQGSDACLDGGVFAALAEHGHALHLGRLDSFNKAGAAVMTCLLAAVPSAEVSVSAA